MTKILERILLSVLVLGVLLAPQTAQVNSYVNGQVLTADQLNSEFGNLYSTINGLDEDNFLSSTVFPATFLSPAAAGNGLSYNVGTGVMAVGVDDVGIEISSDALRLKALGVTTAKLANDSVTSSKIVDGDIVAADIATGGVATAEILDGTIVTADISGTTIFNISAGSAAAPSYSFTSKPQSGMYEGGNTVAFTTVGVLRGYFSSLGLALSTDGSAAAPSYSWDGDLDTGIYHQANVVGISANGSSVATFASGGIATDAGTAIKWKVVTVATGNTSASGTLTAAHGLTVTNFIGMSGGYRTSTAFVSFGGLSSADTLGYNEEVRVSASTTNVIVEFAGLTTTSKDILVTVYYQ